MFRFLLVAALVPVLTLAVEITSCTDDNLYLPLAVRAEGCDGERCEVSKTAPIVFEVDAVVPFDTPYIFPNLYLIFNLPDDLVTEVPIDFPADIYNGCNSLVGSSCPLASGQTITYRLNWDYDATIVEVGNEFIAKFTLYDESETRITCFKVPVTIVA